MKVDSFAQLEPQGLTGMSYILITGGSPDAQRLLSPPGRQPPKIFARRAQLEGLFEGSEDVLDAAQTALFRLTALLSEQNVEEVSATLANLRTLTEQLSSRDALVGDLQQAVQRIDAAASDISAAAGSLQQFGVTAEAFLINDVAPAVNETTAAAQAVNQAAVDTDNLIRTLTPPLENFADTGLEDLNRAASDLRRLIATLERMAAQIENNPGDFVAGSPRETVEVPQ